MQGTPLKDVALEPGKSHCLIIYDCKLAGEASSHPHLRLPPFRQNLLKKLVTGVCTARGDPDALHPSDVFLIADGFKPGNKTALLNSFVQSDNKSMAKTDHTYYVQYEEESLSQRRLRSRGPLLQVEHLVAVTSAPLKVERRPRKHFVGSTHGNSIGPIVLQDLGPAGLGWRLTAEEKRAALGKSGRVLTGGSVKEVVKEAFGLSPEAWSAKAGSCFLFWPPSNCRRILRSSTRMPSRSRWMRTARSPCAITLYPCRSTKN